MIAIFGLTYDDYERFLTIPDVIRRVPMRVFSNEIRHLEKMAIGRVVATTPEYADVHKIELTTGRFLTNEDDLRMANYVVLGSAIADELFPFTDPLGKTVVLNKQDFLVIGVMKDRMPTGGSGGTGGSMGVGGAYGGPPTGGFGGVGGSGGDGGSGSK